MRRFWEYGLLMTVALGIGLAVAAIVAFAMLGPGDAVRSGAGDLTSFVAPLAAGLVSFGIALEIGLRRLNRTGVKAGW